MNRLLATLSLLILLACVRPSVAADDIAPALRDCAAPAVNVDFDGSRHVTVSHGQRQQCQPQQSQVDQGPAITFEKPDSSTPETLVLVVAGIAAVAVGVAVQWHEIAKTVTPVH